MRVAETLHKSIEEVIQTVSVLELRMWYEWFVLQQDKSKETIGGNANNRNPRRR
jgi:hypothetical protein